MNHPLIRMSRRTKLASPSGRWVVAARLALGMLAGLVPVAALAQTTYSAASTSAGTQTGNQAPEGPYRLKSATNSSTETTRGTTARSSTTADQRSETWLPPDRPSDFELYVQKLTGELPQEERAPAAGPAAGQEERRPPAKAAAEGPTVRRFGSELMSGLLRDLDTADFSPLVPPDYLLRSGDELVVTLWGSVDADLRLVVDRSGRITIPRVGPVMVAGVRYAELPEVINRRVSQVFRNFQSSVSLGQLRGQRVYVTGYVRRPGAITVSSLATLAQALIRAGGPSSAGSFRHIELKRGREVVARFDLYDLLLKGDRSADQVLQPDDVVHVGAVGAQVALIGSVNQPAIFEIKAGETVDDLLRMAGGFNAVAERQRLTLQRLTHRAIDRVKDIALPADSSMPLANGDVLRAFNAADVARPVAQQNKRVRVEGEVARPGEYVLPPDSSLSDALRAAGGTTASAYLFGTEFNRESVRATQQQNYERALRDMETQITLASSTRRTTNAEEAAAVTSASAANSRLLEQLRTLKPTGRIVLQLAPDAANLPELALEDGDRLYVPARPTTVGVFGSVFSTGSYLHSANRRVEDYLRLAGGPTRGADQSSVFVIRANGAVSSSLQESGYFSRGNQIASMTAEPGDTIYVPEEMNKTTWTQTAKDWTQILYQFGIGLAGMKSALN